ncbi:unnamed protein product [Cylicocyclus nassatus]|uniref:Cathepsin propeptide inhibitor domain-containing protein n=1 Tax=Cylicocyclus nassatus TaxID=53992 RepID=A0AA36M5C5_CYLNA|nr:unnamed protein product [Cylicocyclus nassatus]
MSVLFVAFLLGVFGHASSSWEMVEVLLASDHYNNVTQQHTALYDFIELFDEFAEQNGLHFNKRNFRQLEAYISGLPVARYGIRNIDCEAFRNFLSGVKAQRYHLQYASVKCGGMTYSFCMGFACDPYGYVTASPYSTTAW